MSALAQSEDLLLAESRWQRAAMTPAYLMDGMDEQERRIRRLMDAGISEPEAYRIVAEAGNEMEKAA